jgi:tungstate transport system substrate-binding protein
MNTTGKIVAAALIVIIASAIGAYAYVSIQPTNSPVTLTISSTTSLYETGVENDAIKPAFEAKYPWITVNFLAQGTGAAIQTAMRGDADMIMVHAPSQEASFLSDGYGVNQNHSLQLLCYCRTSR